MRGASTPPRGPRRNICFDFQKGSCTRGTSCRYLHSKSPAGRTNRSGGHRHQHSRSKSTHDNSPFFEPWYSKTKLDRLIEENKVFTGVLRIPTKARNLAFVAVDGISCDVLIDGEKNRNRSLNGDVVALELLPQDQWNERATKHIAQDIAELDLGPSKANDDFWMPQVSDEDVAKWTYKREDNKDSTEKETKVVVPKGLQPVGKVVGIIAANEAEAMSSDRMAVRGHTGTLVPQYGFKRAQSPIKPGEPLPVRDMYVEFRPTDSRVPYMLIPRGQVPIAFLEDPSAFAPPDQRLFVCSLAQWSEKFRFPQGRFIRQIGQAGEVGPETEAILVENDCDHGDFPPEVLSEMEAYLALDSDRAEGEWRIPDEEIARRRDLRDTRIVSIDPATAKDLDDALHCTFIPKSSKYPEHYEVGVHIADVTYFVRPGTAVDREAKRRATTVYLVHKVIPMLPPVLSEQLCSLNPGVDRLAYSVIWKMTKDGELLRNTIPWYGRTVIRSCAKLDYGLAQQMIDGKVTASDATKTSTKWPANRQPAAPHTPAGVIADVKNLAMIGMSRREKRFDPKTGGSCMMKSIKLSFSLDENGNPSGMRSYPIYDSNKLIEEFMLLANYLVAQYCIQVAKSKAFLRWHPKPDKTGMDNLVKELNFAGLGHLVAGEALTSSSGLHKTLQKIQRSESENMYIFVNQLIQLPLKQAQYFAAADSEKYLWRHWALNMPYYTHFTSPIRRYADICVHRVLTAALQPGAFSYDESEEELEEKAEHCNVKKDASKTCQDACDKVFFCIYVRDKFKNNTPLTATGMVRSMGEKSLTLLLVEFGVDCLVHAQNDWGATATECAYEPTPGGAQDDEGEGNTPKNRRRNEKEETPQSEKRNKKKKQPTKTVIGMTITLPKKTLQLKLASSVKVRLKPSVSSNGRIDFTTELI